MTSDGIVQITIAAITLLGTIITVVIAPLIVAKYSKEKRAEIKEYVDAAVAAADQILKIEDPSGTKRKAFVLQKLNEKGFKINESDLNILIEAAVKQLNIIQNKALE